MPVPLIELSAFSSPEAQRCYDNYAHDSRYDDDIVMMTRISVGLRSQDLAVKTASAKAARRIMSRTQDPPVSMMISAGVIRPLVEALDRNDCYDMQFEAAWALTNIASGTHEHTMAVVDCGAIPKLVSLVPRGGNIGEQSAWVLSNIAGDGSALRDMVLHAGAVPALLPLLAVTTPTGHLKTAVWTFSNFCRGKDPVADFDLVAAALPYISDLLELQDRHILADACWAISYLSDGPNDRIEGVQATPDLLARLVALISHSTTAVQIAALRALGNMLTGSNEQTDRCLDAGCLGPLNELLTADKASLVKDAAWACSNILAGPPQQIQRLIDSGALLKLVAVTQHTNTKCQREAAWAFTNLCSGGTTEQLDALLQSGFLEPYCALLASLEANIVVVVLDGLSYLLKAALKCGQEEALCIILEEIGALDQIEQLNELEDEQIYEKSSHILETYFPIQDEGVIITANFIEDETQFGFN